MGDDAITASGGVAAPLGFLDLCDNEGEPFHLRHVLPAFTAHRGRIRWGDDPRENPTWLLNGVGRDNEDRLDLDVFELGKRVARGFDGYVDDGEWEGEPVVLQRLAAVEVARCPCGPCRRLEAARQERERWS